MQLRRKTHDAIIIDHVAGGTRFVSTPRRRRANACWEGRLMESFQPILRNSIRRMARNLDDPPAQDVATACCIAIVHDKSLP